MLSAVLKKALRAKTDIAPEQMKETLTVKLAATEKSSRLFYRFFSEMKRTAPQKSQQQWDKDCVRAGNV